MKKKKQTKVSPEGPSPDQPLSGAGEDEGDLSRDA